MRALLALLLMLLLAAPAFSVQPDEVLADPALEARARAISVNLRCLVCQNQSIDDSDADLAGDLRVIVRERLVAGDTDQQVFDYVVARYGEYVLLNPVIAPHTVVLWIAGPLALLIGGFGLWRLSRRARPNDSPSELTVAEKQALAELEK